MVLVATEDIGGGVEVQRVKLMLGAHGQDGGDVTGPNPLPVEVQNTTDTDSPVWGNRNKDPQPFVWTADADLILGKVLRLCERISNSAH
ncbi:MAG: hypothetical protein LAP87_28370 [Acidobacteriia bacterium]|nr:hypothetical protein [Terriglobia bacterium]